MSITRTKAFDPSLTDWFSEAGYGVMVHWTTQTHPENGSMKSYFDAVEDFDVEAFVDQLEEAGAGYVVFTICHREMYFPFPNSVLDSVLPGRTCQTRDLMSDLYDALNPKGIKMMFYYNNIAVDAQDHEWYIASRYHSDPDYFAQLMYDITSEIGTRYGNKLVGWWLDNLHEEFNMDEKFGDFSAYTEALKTGNANRIVTYNFTGTSTWNTSKPYGIEDYQAGEETNINNLPSSRFSGQCKSQWHACANMDYNTIPWFYDGEDEVEPNYSNEAVNNYIRNIMLKGGVFSYNAANYQEGHIDSDTMNQLRVVKRAIRVMQEDGVNKVDNFNPNILYIGSWSHISQTSNYNDSISYSATAKDSMQYTFSGTSIKLYTKKGPGAGKFDIYFDDIKVVDAYDSYSSSCQYGVLAYDNQNLTLGSHTIKLVVLHTKNSNSTNYYCHLDYLEYKN